MTCFSCKILIVGRGTPVHGHDDAFRCDDCMRQRTAACEIACESRGEKKMAERGHTEDSGFRKRAKKGCVACGADVEGTLCPHCRELGERYWARALSAEDNPA